MAELTLKGARKVYPGGIEAVRGIDLAIADGEFIVLVGPSGCGKSTLLRMIAGLEAVTAGDIAIGARRVNDLEPADRDIAMVFQNYALYPHMSVYDNMAYGLRNRRTPRAEIDVRVRETARILEIDGLLDRRPRQLSGGQRQRVAMGRAIVRKPAVFLFDEPLSNLDAKLRVQMRVEIRRLQRQLATTSIYVTHDQVEAMTMADRLVVMNAGIAEQVGTPREIYRRPATRFVASFIGSPAMNFLAGRIAAGGTAVEAAGLVLPLPGAPLPAGTAVEVGIRPEHLTPTDARDGAIPVAIELVEHLGTDTLVHARLAAARGQSLVFRVGGDHEFPAEGEVRLAVSPDALHLFEPETGRRLD